MTKRESFVTLMEMLGETFNRPLTGGLLEGYWLVLEDLTEAEMRAAVKGALMSSKFMPTPGELRAVIRRPIGSALDAIQAWQVVRKAIDKFDYLVNTIDFGPLVNAVIRNLGGWDTLCTATLPELDNPGWLRKRFEEVYRSLATADPQSIHGEALTGALPPKWDPKDKRDYIVPLDGSAPVLRIEANGASDARASIAAHIASLADDKAAE